MEFYNKSRREHMLEDMRDLRHKNEQLMEHVKNIQKIIKANKESVKDLELIYETISLILDVSKED